MGNENAERIQTSILYRAEQKLVAWLIKRMPAWVTSDMLSYTGLVAAIGYAFFCWMANFNLYYFWLSSLCLVLNWFGDSLDGTMARYRGTGRPKYGFFIDHSLDALTTCLFCIGLGLSPMMQLSISLFIMGGYLCLSIYTYLSTIIIGKFPLTYVGMGPTEMRLLIIVVCLIYTYLPCRSYSFPVCGVEWTFFDLAGALVAAILYLIYICSMARDLRALAKIDPPKPYHKNKD
ncbi:MAG: CDP-alcohol phosphatidyltransferase family protein [Muribaculaceae bacterium]|nr:CDP-alcohol phosphatidyltransferase family protein [Muribaculaceae bacterium]